MARMAPLSITLLIAGLVIGGAVGYYFTRVMWATDLDALYATQDIDLLRWELVLLRSHESQKGGYLSMEERVKLAACQHYEYATTVAAEETDWSTRFSHPLKRRLVSKKARELATRDLEFINKRQSDLLTGCEEVLAQQYGEN